MSEITPEKVASAVCEGMGGWRESLQGALSLSADGNVLSAKIARWDEKDTETVRHFRAVVVEGDETPLVLEWPAELGMQWDDGKDLLALKPDGIVFNLRGIDEWDLDPDGALELAAQLAAMAHASKALARKGGAQ
jgi:hypothetical protein